MTVYERIKARRIELGLSADIVAEALGVSRATVYRYESSYIEKLPTTVLESLSKILKCSPAYLMGWEESVSPSPAADLQLTDTERSIILEYRKADPIGKEMVLRVLGIVEKGESQNLA